MHISSVVFDYGSVLGWPPSSESCARVAAFAGIPESVLRERYYLERSAYDRDTINSVEYWRRIAAGYPAADDENLLLQLADMDVEIWSERNESTVGWLPKLRAAGLTLAILSNMPDSFCTALEENYRWLDVFHHRIFSGRIRLNKPEPAMYRLLLDTLSNNSGPLPPEEVLFLDDLEKNVDGARALGINAERYSVFHGGLTEIAGRYGLPLPEEVTPPESRLRDVEWAPHHQAEGP